MMGCDVMCDAPAFKVKEKFCRIKTSMKMQEARICHNDLILQYRKQENEMTHQIVWQ